MSEIQSSVQTTLIDKSYEILYQRNKIKIYEGVHLKEGVEVDEENIKRRVETKGKRKRDILEKKNSNLK